MVYLAYLETGRSGQCMAHVLSLPGCTVRAAGHSEAVRRLPDEIRAYHAWLRRHGEPAPPDGQPLVVEVAEHVHGCGPFDPGDDAALFAPDLEPVTPEQMERFFQLMAYSRADLLALVSGLADDLLDWQADSETFTLRRILRHVGNAEQWYVSRLVPPATLPQEWSRDEALPIFALLEMERRTAIARLRELTPEERTAIHHPTVWTRHPEEPWTARKALRRFVEHEREHTAQVEGILTRWRQRSSSLPSD